MGAISESNDKSGEWMEGLSGKKKVKGQREWEEKLRKDAAKNGHFTLGKIRFFFPNRRFNAPTKREQKRYCKALEVMSYLDKKLGFRKHHEGRSDIVLEVAEILRTKHKK